MKTFLEWIEEDVNHQNCVVIHAQNEGFRDLFPKVSQGFRKGVGTAALVGASVFGGADAMGAGHPFLKDVKRALDSRNQQAPQQAPQR